MNRITGTLHEEQCTFFITSRIVLLRVRNVQRKFVEKIQTHLCRGTFFSLRKSCRVWDNVEKHCRSGQ